MNTIGKDDRGFQFNWGALPRALRTQRFREVIKD